MGGIALTFHRLISRGNFFHAFKVMLTLAFFFFFFLYINNCVLEVVFFFFSVRNTLLM